MTKYTGRRYEVGDVLVVKRQFRTSIGSQLIEVGTIMVVINVHQQSHAVDLIYGECLISWSAEYDDMWRYFEQQS